MGHGGAGEVYEVRDQRDHARLALKTVVYDRVHSTKALERFRREMEFSQRISHRNVLRIFELFEVTVDVPAMPGRARELSTADIPCMIMEFLDGETLADRLGNGERFSTDDAKPIICQLAAGLAEAHAQGIVHRDLKPDNIFLVPDGDDLRVVVTDFGVARRAVAEPEESLTASNVIVGTPTYMAPEQLELEKAMPASDLYTVGLVMFGMLTGRQPFEGETVIKMVFKRVQEDAPSPRKYLPELDRRWEAAIQRCLERHPEARFESPLDIIRVLDGEDSSWLEAERKAQRRKLLLLALAWVAGLAVIGGVLWVAL